MEELSKNIRIGKGYSILFPNAFTPNGDEVNDEFRPVFNGLSEIQLRIYDSRGALIADLNNIDHPDPEVQSSIVSLEGWDGNYQNSFEKATGPYFIYSVTALTIDDEEVKRDGTFVIIRWQWKDFF